MFGTASLLGVIGLKDCGREVVEGFITEVVCADGSEEDFPRYFPLVVCSEGLECS